MAVCQCENLSNLIGFDVVQFSEQFKTENDYIKFVSFDFEPKYRTKRFLIFCGSLIPVGEDDGCNRDVVVKVRRERPASDDYWGHYFVRSGLSRNVAAKFERIIDNELDLDIEFVNEYEAKFSGYSQWNEIMMQFKDYNHRTLTTGEHIVIEPYLLGKFQNFDKDHDNVIDSLAHFSYHTSRGQYLLHGLKGVKFEESYRLTVPLVHSVTQDFGPRDKGMEGILTFFQKHMCTDICYGWLKPDKMDINMNRESSVVCADMKETETTSQRGGKQENKSNKSKESIYHSISEYEYEKDDYSSKNLETSENDVTQKLEYQYAKVEKKPKSKDSGFDEIDLNENCETSTEYSSVYGGSQDTGYSSIRELKELDKEHGDDAVFAIDISASMEDPDETKLVGVGNIHMYTNTKVQKYIDSVQLEYLDIHAQNKMPPAMHRDYENEKFTTTAVVHRDFEFKDSVTESLQRSSSQSSLAHEDVYDTIDYDIQGQKANKIACLNKYNENEPKSTVV